jgi:general secretion pathway protein I
MKRELHIPATARRRSRQRGFTLVEVLAALMLMAVVLPSIMRGIDAAGEAASASRRRTEAAGLAERKLNELVAGQSWQGGQMAGDFSPDAPDYQWQATVANWQLDNTSAGLQQLDVKVTWQFRNHPQSVTVSTLTYVRSQQQ